MNAIALAQGSTSTVLTPEPAAGNYFVAAYPPFSAWSPQHLPAFNSALAGPSSEPIGLYVHLPFCQHKCDYCYYLSYIAQPAKVVDRYVSSLVRELELLGNHPGVSGRPVSFAYFGGGTPSTLNAEQIHLLTGGLQRVLPWDDAEEVTYECAPRSVKRSTLSALRHAGISRISMGVQTFSDRLLKLNGRVHLATDVVRAFGLIRAAGFDRINLDLMCGLLGETEDTWDRSVGRTIELDPESVTIYQTEIPHNTKLYRNLEAGTLPAAPVSWETKRARLNRGFGLLESAGYTVVSAYNAVKDPEKHRLRYQDHLWRGADMLGLGVASFGYIDGVHYQNDTTLEKYEAAVDRDALPVKRAFPLSTADRVVREFILQLKLGEVPSAPFRTRYGVDILREFKRPLRSLEAEGFLTYDRSGVRLTRAGLLRVDRLLPLFYEKQHREVRYT